MGNNIITDECTYFDQKKTCSICGERPAMRKTGKCTPHSVTPYDMGRKDDWVDCYEGCLKHDKEYRKKVHTAAWDKRARAAALAAKPAPSPLPSINRLYLLHQHAKNVRDERLGKIIDEALTSRGLKKTTVAREALGRTDDYLQYRVSGKMPFTFMDVCELLEYLRKHDKLKKMGEKK